ncbi:permease [Clostridium swellfunianum]|uniref:permease n=1 Tax=Clostridium swellfunianum TaxID=1367462 RepID=UPI002547110D|nr:permease [Clostridium swellfunianum]MCM0647589.1 permease [Clostridium swellfunianum]
MNVAKKNKLLFMVGAVYLVLLVAMPDKAARSSENSTYYVIEMLQIMPVIFILTSLIEAWVPREAITNSFGENSGVKGTLFSFVLGSFSAGPIYAAFPVCKMLLKKGASVSNIVVILSAWAVIKIPMLANEAKFLGPKFMLIRWVLTTISIFAMAYIISKAVNKESLVGIEDKKESESSALAIKHQYCIGCGLCEKLSPNTFIISDKKAKIIVGNVKIEDLNNIENINKAVEKCPAKAIYFKA